MDTKQQYSRYILPVAMHAHLYHTISGLTLHRYHRLCDQFDVPLEQKIIEAFRWEQTESIDRVRERLLASGADRVVTTLLEARDYLAPLIQIRSHAQETGVAV